MNSLIDRANSTSYFGVAEKKSHWKYDWYATTSPETSSGSHTHANADSSRGNEDGKHSLRFKTWLRSDMPVFGGWPDIEKSDLFDLSKYTTNANSSSTKAKNGHTINTGAVGDSMTEEDIRGAVGNSESMITLSSSAANANAAQPDSTASADTKEEPKVQAEQVMNANNEDEKPQAADVEGDVNME